MSDRPGRTYGQRSPWRRWMGGAAILLGSAVAGQAAAGPSTDRLFEQCARHLHRPADEVSLRCRHYLEFADDDDSGRKRRVRSYVDQAERSSTAWNPVPVRWRHHPDDETVLVPDLLRREGDYRVDVVRTYGSAWENGLLRRAEAIYPARRPAHCAEQPAPPGVNGAPPSGWWCGVLGPLRRAAVPSPAALQYYLEWTEAASDPDRPVDETVRFAESNLVYLAAIGFRERFTIGKQRFQRVYVAQVNLGWDMSAAGAPSTGFMINKIVVFNGDGSVAALFDDHPVNRAGPAD